MATGGAPASLLARVIAYFRRHPVVLLLAFTPGIPEYLSGSSSVALGVRNPGVFLLFLGLNLGLYGPGVLLVREAHVRWKKGWSTLLLLGSAYGLLEEGTALSTLFNPRASVVGGLGSYSHAYGVSWVWLIGVLGIHLIYSVGLPIVLLGLALPATRGRPFLSGYRLPLTLFVYAADITILAIAVHYTPGFGLIVLAAVVAGILWAIAWWLPAGLLDPPKERPARTPSWFFVYGLIFYPILLLTPAFGEYLRWPGAVTFAVDFALAALLFLVVRREIGRAHNEPHLIALAVGALAPIVVFGLIAQIFLPVVLALDVLVVLFFRTLWRHYRPAAAAVPIPPGVTL